METPPQRRPSSYGHDARAPGKARDPHWELVVEMAVSIWVDGTYVTQVDRLPTQRFVDVQWAARQAGRVLGGRSQVTTSRANGPTDDTVTITVTVSDPDGRGLQRAEEGLETLLRVVLEERTGG